jgi:hypothetical protein
MKTTLLVLCDDSLTQNQHFVSIMISVMIQISPNWNSCMFGLGLSSQIQRIIKPLGIYMVVRCCRSELREMCNDGKSYVII